jgi:CheY-like chemotaxis protein
MKPADGAGPRRPARGRTPHRSARRGIDGRAEPLQVLLVEDDGADARLFVEAFRDLDLPARIETAPTGGEALGRLRHADTGTGAPTLPDVIFLDLNLPRIDGREVLAQIRGDPALAGLPVIVVTASRQDEDVLHAFDHHAEGYLRKPVEPSTLRALLARLDLLS